MKIPIYCFFIAVLLPVMTVAQEVTFSTHTVATDFQGPAGIWLADLDDNGFLDIVCAGADANTIACWMNTGDSPPSWTQQVIDDEFNGAIYVSAGDIDGDGKQDILGAAWQGHELAWWHNSEDGFAKYSIKEAFTKAHEVKACDVDLDGDMDVLGVSAGLNRICWYENDGNMPVTWTEYIVGLNFGGARSVDAADVDGDGDVDLVGAALLDNEISWWRNDGGDPIEWTEITVATGFTYAHKVQFADMDGDGDKDILGTAYSKGLSWWENNGADSTEWSAHFISVFNAAVIGWAVDIDEDEDMDIVCTAQNETGRIGLWSSDGVYPFDWDYSAIETNLSESWPLHYGDMDNDGDIDLVCGGNAADEIRWYQNDLITSVNTSFHESTGQPIMTCCTLPAEGSINIRLQLNTGQQVRLGIYDLSGRLIEVIANDYLPKGSHEYLWKKPQNGQHIYIASLRTTQARESLKLLISR
jgi:hypothetical protein